MSKELSDSQLVEIEKRIREILDKDKPFFGTASELVMVEFLVQLVEEVKRMRNKYE